jgi:hypothetical protein
MGVQGYFSTSMLYQWFAIFGVLFGVGEQKVSMNAISLSLFDNQQVQQL